MAPKKNQSKGPTTTVLGLSKMTPSLLDDLARRGFVSADDVRAPATGETVAHPRTDEVVVFRDLFTADLRMPLDPVVVDIFWLFKVFFASNDSHFDRAAQPVDVAGEDLLPFSKRRRLRSCLQGTLPTEEDFRIDDGRRGDIGHSSVWLLYLRLPQEPAKSSHFKQEQVGQ